MLLQLADNTAKTKTIRANKAGLVENDIILEVDGKKLDKDSSLARIVAGKNVGETIKLKVMSKGSEKEIEIKLEEMT